MKIHEHLVRINPPGVPELSRAQVWAGLVRRAEDPLEFMLGLEAATVLERSEVGGDTELHRELDFGSFTVRDRVRLRAAQESRTTVEASERWPASSLTVRIEEPEPGAVFLRFTYEADEAEASSALDEMSLTLRRQAYEQSDLDTARRIRTLAEAGELG